MSLPCLQGASAFLQCSSECTRWDSINRGEPLRVYIDKDTWDPTWYDGVALGNVALDEPDPQVYIQAAMNVWQEAVECQLFEFVEDRADAQLVIQYPLRLQADNPNDDGRLGDATCFCDAAAGICAQDNDVWPNFIATGTPHNLNIYLRDSGGYGTINQFVYIHIHELGHTLGLGHAFNQPNEPSYMGFPPDTTLDPVLPDLDRSEIQRRYTCDCPPLRQAVTQLVTPQPLQNTSDSCPFCQGVSQ